MKVWKTIKSWNWSNFVFILGLSLMAALGNKNVDSLKDALILGAVGGVIIGLPFAVAGKDVE